MEDFTDTHSTPITVVDVELNEIYKILAFATYCKRFYNEEDGLYPIANNNYIDSAVMDYVCVVGIEQMGYDTWDREGVREIIEHGRVIREDEGSEEII